ncbi:MAG: DUF6519 domain-containing protein, partial [Specibacter sp.]
MKGDFSRDTFNQANHYTRVLWQQGRVQLDADVNEQAAITEHFRRTLAADLIGPHGGPAGNLGFGISTDRSALGALRDPYGRPLDPGLLKALDAALGHGDFLIGTGRYYVDGAMCENDGPLLFSGQAGYPFDAASALDALRDTGPFLIYLDAWERHVSYVEDPEIRDIALGGPDTATRARLDWQVRLLHVDAGTAAPPDLAGVLAPGTSALRARATAPDTANDPCTVDPRSRYRGLENQLYRVEIHRPGQAGSVDGAAPGASFKWSRENGSVILAVLGAPVPDMTAQTTTLTLASLGRDADLGLVVGGWVELVDDDVTARHLAGPLLRVHAINPDDSTVVLEGLAGVDPATDGFTHPYLRRWDQAGDPDAGGAAAVVEAPAGQDAWIALEDGVEIEFPAQFLPGQPNQYRTGDYWLIPARTATGDLDWPTDPGGPSPLPPRGERHAFAPLALA